MTIKNYCVTIANGRSHLASFNEEKNSNYIGSVNSYNNVLTQLFARLFNLSIGVTINGRTQKLNKSSYLKFLANAGTQDINTKNIKNYLNLDSLKLLSTKGPMRAHLPSDIQNRLGKKMIAQMKNKQWDQALHTAHQGADVDLTFFFEDDNLLFFGNPLKRSHHGYSFVKKHETFNPALYAAKEGQKDFIEEIKKLGANLTFIGTQGVFTRKILLCNDACRGIQYQDHLRTTSEFQIAEDFSLSVQLVDKTQSFNKVTIIFPRSHRPVVCQEWHQQKIREKAS